MTFMHLGAHYVADLDYLVRLVVAVVLTGALGWERGRSGKSAGLRTHMIIGLGAALFIILPEVLIEYFRLSGELVRFDPGRIVQGVVAGISFVGAGTIFVSKAQDHVRGLTTAASIWTTTGIGMCAGLGRFLLAAEATALLLIVLHILRIIEPEKNEGWHDDVGQPTLPGQESTAGESVAQSARRRANPGA